MSAPAESAPFFTRYGFARTKNADAPLSIAPYPQVCHRGVLRPTVIASAIDLVGSLFARAVAGTDATFTVDLSLRAPIRHVPDRIEARGGTIRTGRRLLTTAVELHANDTTFAYGQTTFTRIPRSPGDEKTVEEIGLPETIESNPLERPLADEVGIRVIDSARGRVEVELRDALRNPEGVMQGALIALITEVSGELLADTLAGEPQIVTEMDIRYLSTIRVGPVVGRARSIGPPDSRMLRVDLHDAGNEGRLTTSSLLRVAPAPLQL